MRRRSLFGLLLSAALSVQVVAQDPVTVTLPASKDNTLYESQSGSLSNGAGSALFSGRTAQFQGSLRRAVLAFDLSGIPAGSTITAASLRLRQSSPLDSGNQSMQLHRLQQDWGEGASNASGNEGGGTAAATGDATWLHTFFNTSFWTVPGGDFRSVASASLIVGSNGDHTWQSQGLIDDVQDWVDQPAGNFGWILVGNESTGSTAKRFSSRESSVGFPVLTVTYTPPATEEPGILELTQDVVETVESAGSAQVGVTRTGGSDGEVSAAYATADGTATAGEDYSARSGRIVFADGESGTKFIEIPILDEDIRVGTRFEGIETFQLVLSDPDGGAQLGDRTVTEIRILDDEDLSFSLNFPQFGNGDGFLSQLFLVHPDTGRSAAARVIGRTSSGEPFLLNSGIQPQAPAILDTLVELAPGGIHLLETSGEGELQVGSVEVRSDSALEGVVILGGSFGLAGVQAADDFPAGFLGPVDNRLEGGVRTGVAIQNLDGSGSTFPARLLNAGGQPVANSSVTVPGHGQKAQFVDEMEWDQPVDFESFLGSLWVDGEDLSAVMIQNRDQDGISQFATLPVARQVVPEDAPASSVPAQETEPSRIYFPQFGNGDGFVSRLFLINPDRSQGAQARIVGRTSSGLPFELHPAEGEGDPLILDLEVELAPGGTYLLETSGTGELQVGGLVVTSDIRLDGVVVFGGSFGLAGVQAADEFSEGLVGPVDHRLDENVRTGIAVQNLESFDVAFPTQLLNSGGEVVANADLTVPALGQLPLFIDEIPWDQPVDLGSFQGTLKIFGQGLSAVMIQNRIVNGVSQFATVPVTGN